MIQIRARGDIEFKLEENVAQALMDNLWESGVRPSSGGCSASGMDAVERHIENLWKKAFRALDEVFKSPEIINKPVTSTYQDHHPGERLLK